jgi:predicted permease
MKHLGWLLGTFFSAAIIFLELSLEWDSFIKIFGFTVIMSFAFGTIVYRIFRETQAHRESAVKKTSIFSSIILIIPIVSKLWNNVSLAHPSYPLIIFTSVSFLVIPIIAMLHEDHKIRYKKSIEAADEVKKPKKKSKKN